MADNENFDSETTGNAEKLAQGTDKSAASQSNSDKSGSDSLMPSFEEILKKQRMTNSSPLENSKKEFLSDIVAKIGRSQNQDKSEDVPSLDLGSQILARQRKIAAIKRKSPAASTAETTAAKPQTQSETVAIASFGSPPASPQQKIIFDIVAKNIQSLLAMDR